VDLHRIYPLLEAFRWAPSSYNRQPWRIVLVTDPAVREAMLTFKDRGVAQRELVVRLVSSRSRSRV
jgi:nitroreductase